MSTQMFENYPDIVSVDDVQTMLGVGRNTVYSMLQDNVLKYGKVGKKYIIPKQSVINYVLGICSVTGFAADDAAQG